MRKARLILLFIIFPCFLHAEEFKITSQTEPVQKSGYYKIVLPPEIIGNSALSYQDIRIFDKNGKEIPYIFKEEKPYSSISGFQEYDLLENNHNGSKKESRVVVHNNKKEVLTSLTVVIRNSDIAKEITLRGSDNGVNWYIIQKAYPEKTGTYNTTASLFQIRFPESNYEYLELTTNDKKTDPVQFLKVGYFDSKIIRGLYTEVLVAGYSQTDSSNKKSYIRVYFKRNYEISKYAADFTGPEFYRREAKLGIPRVVDGKRKVDYFFSFDILSGIQPEWETEKIRTKELLIEIENSDNSPLKLSSFKAFQINKYLIARLDSGMHYAVKSGNSTLRAPDYDLQYFSDSIQEIGTITPDKMKLEMEEDTVSKNFITKTILWTIILLVIGLLGFLSIRMISEMRKRE